MTTQDLTARILLSNNGKIFTPTSAELTAAKNDRAAFVIHGENSARPVIDLRTGFPPPSVEHAKAVFRIKMGK